MAVQDTYNENMDALRLGHIYDTGNKDLISRTFEGAEGDVIAFGAPVAQGTGDRQARATAAGDTAIIGITARERSALESQYAVGADMRIIRKGPITVEAGATVAAGDPVHVVVDGGTFSNADGVELAGAMYESSGDAGDLVKVRLA